MINMLVIFYLVFVSFAEGVSLSLETVKVLEVFANGNGRESCDIVTFDDQNENLGGLINSTVTLIIHTLQSTHHVYTIYILCRCFKFTF